MSWEKIGAILLFALALAVGQVLFKIAAQHIKGPIGFDSHTLGQLIFNPYLLLSLALYAVTTLYWVLLLREIDLSRAYLAIALALVLVPLSGTILFGEPLTARLVIGLGIILAGLAVALW